MSSFHFLAGSKLTHVFDRQTGMVLDAAQVIGEGDHAILLRTRLLEDIHNDAPRYVCWNCFKPIILRSNPQKTGQFFAHYTCEYNCPYFEKHGISEEAIRAIRYNGAKESPAHIEIKNLLVESMEVDSRFAEIKKEKRWEGEVEKGKFRKPDVQAIYIENNKEIRISFEIQLSATFLSEIVGRREFYRKELGLLIWVFRDFSFENMRTTKLDILYPNNMNAYVVNSESRDISLVNNELFLQCFWASPEISGSNIVNKHHEEYVPFSKIQKDQVHQLAYYYDYNKNADILINNKHEAELTEICSEFIQYCRTDGQDKRQQLKQFSIRFAKHFSDHLDVSRHIFRVVKSIISLREGKPIGSGFQRLIQFGHEIYRQEPQYILYFLAASNVYGRKELLEKEGTPEIWKEKKDEIWDDIKKNTNSKYLVNDNSNQLIFHLFPEIQREYNQILTAAGKSKQL